MLEGLCSRAGVHTVCLEMAKMFLDSKAIFINKDELKVFLDMVETNNSSSSSLS